MYVSHMKLFQPQVLYQKSDWPSKTLINSSAYNGDSFQNMNYVT